MLAANDWPAYWGHPTAGTAVSQRPYPVGSGPSNDNSDLDTQDDCEGQKGFSLQKTPIPTVCNGMSCTLANVTATASFSICEKNSKRAAKVQ